MCSSITSEGLAAARRYIHSIPVARRATTDITLMELFKGAMDRQELESIEAFLERNLFVILPLTASASRGESNCSSNTGFLTG